MAYTNSRGGEKPSRRSNGPERNSGGEGKKIFNRNDKGRSSDSRGDRKPYGDSPRGSYNDRPRTDRPYNADRSGSDRPYSKDRSYGDKPFNKDRSFGDKPYSKDRKSDRPYNADRPYNRERASGSDRTAAAPAVRKEATKNSARTARPLKSQPTTALG